MAKVVHKNLVRSAIRKLAIIFALAGEVGIDLDAMPDVANEYERWPAIACRQRLGVVFRLPPRVYHQHVPGAIGTAAALRVGIRLQQVGLPSKLQLLRALIQAALLSLHHERAALVEIDPPRRGRAVGILEANTALECVGVQSRVGAGRGRRCDPDQRAQFLGEALKIFTLRAGRRRPADNEFLDRRI